MHGTLSLVVLTAAFAGLAGWIGYLMVRLYRACPAVRATSALPSARDPAGLSSTDDPADPSAADSSGDGQAATPEPVA